MSALPTTEAKRGAIPPYALSLPIGLPLPQQWKPVRIPWFIRENEGIDTSSIDTAFVSIEV